MSSSSNDRLEQNYLDLHSIIDGPEEQLDFVLPGLLAETVGVLLSPGGAGKSMLALELATTVATGRDAWGLVGAEPTAGSVICRERSAAAGPCEGRAVVSDPVPIVRRIATDARPWTGPPPPAPARGLLTVVNDPGPREGRAVVVARALAASSPAAIEPGTGRLANDPPPLPSASAGAL